MHLKAYTSSYRMCNTCSKFVLQRKTSSNDIPRVFATVCFKVAACFNFGQIKIMCFFK